MQYLFILTDIFYPNRRRHRPESGVRDHDHISTDKRNSIGGARSDGIGRRPSLDAGSEWRGNAVPVYKWNAG